MARKTIDDVAALAGVSIKTVSRVLNDEPTVRLNTRQRVQEAMTALNYQPSQPARSLAGRRSSLIGLVYENPSANYVFSVQNGAIARCRETKMRLFVQSCNDLGDRLVDDVTAMVDQTHVDGLVITPPVSANEELIAALERRTLPFVLIGPDDAQQGATAVLMDDRAAAREMTDYLFELGHHRIGFVAGHPEHHSSRYRLEGYRDALKAHGAEVPAQWVEQGYNTAASGTAAGRRLLTLPERPTAIFASNDDMAAGVILAAHEFGIDVPDALSVAGFDDTELASFVWPTLTTIRQPTFDMAYIATGLLIDMIKEKPVPPVTQVAFTMMKRGSTAPPHA
jgi:LacI family transcriptional regulator